MSFPSGAVRSIGLSKSRRLKSTSSSIAMSLEDETQQPLVAGSSQPPGAASSAAILRQLHQQYAPSAPSGPGAGPTHHIIPPSSDPPVAPSSDVTQGPESDGSIAWESNPVLLPPHGSLHCALLDQIAEDPRPSQPVSQPKALTSQGLPASGKSSELTDLVSKTPEFVMESQRDGVDSAKSEMSDVEEDADAASVSTPSTSESEMQTAPAPRTFGLFSGPAMRPITQSVPGLATSPIRTYISPSQHVAKLFTPTKNAKGHLASPSKRYDALPVTFLTVGSQTASTTSSPSKPTRLPTQAAHRGSPILSPKRSALECSPIGDSSDFAEDMMPVRVLNPRERFDATMEAAPLALNEASCSTRSSQASPTRPAHWEALTTQRDSAGCAGEPTFSNENSMDKHDYRNHLVAISRRPFQPDKAQSEVADSEPPSTPTRRPAAVRDVESQTLLNTIAPQGSQTQLNSDNLSPSSSIPRGHFASLDARSAAALSSPGLWGERMPNDEDISVPTATSPPQESFVATQVKPLHPTTSSPFKQLLPATTSSPSNVAQFGRRRAGDEHNTSTTAPPSDADLEPTFVEAVSHSSAGSLEAAQLTASDPPLLRLFPSSIERCSAPELTTVTALGFSTSSPPRPCDEHTQNVREQKSSPAKKSPLSGDGSGDPLFGGLQPRNSPIKYGRRHNRTSHIPSTRGGMPHQPPASDDGSATEQAPLTVENCQAASPLEPSCAPQEELRPSPILSQSSSSSSAQDDPEDETFRDSSRPDASLDTEQGDMGSASLAESPSPDVATGRASTCKTKTAAVPRGRATSQARSRPVRRKRKARSSSPEFSDSSSSAPEDREDFSYRPTELGRTKAKAEAVAERTTKASIGSHSPRPDQPAKGKGKRTAVTRSSPNPSKRSRAPTSAPTSPPHKTRSTKRHKRAAISVPTRPSRSMTSMSRTKDASVTAAEAQKNGPLRVLAQWNKGDYYAGTVTSRNAGGYHVDFDDGHEVWVSLEQMRLLELRPGEPVCERTPGHVYHVAEQYEGFGDIQAVDTHSKVHRIRVTHLLVLGLEIVRRFSDRCVPRAEMDKRFPESVDVFARKVFIVTSSDERGKDTLIKKIQQNGGSVTSNWTDIFDISDEAHTINTQDKAPFLVWLGSKRVVSSKLMSSLAAGVPVLSPRYIEDTLNGPADWRAYLISPGESALLREPAVQVVDPAWGSASWRASEAQAARQPLAGASVLWVPAGGRWKGHHEINILVPFCLRAMGACITIAASLPADLGAVEQEIVAVEDRDGRKLTKQQRLSGKLVNVGWLKAVLIAGARLPPSIIRN